MSDRRVVQRLARVAPPLGFLAVAAILTLVGWLRPPLSEDIDAVHLPLGLTNTGQRAEDLLQGARQVPVDSAGLLVLVLLACGAVAIIFRPRYFPVVAGVLLSVAIAANAAVALNHPALIERMESERDQREQVVQVLRVSPSADPLSTPTNGRVAPAGDVTGDRAWRDIFRPWDYLLYGRWLIVWAAIGVWFGTPRRPANRWRQIASWTAVGLLLGAGLCLARLRAEYHWIAANAHERRGEFDDARRRLETATDLYPEFRRLQRTWLLTGRLDYLASRSTAAETLFRSSQIMSVARSQSDEPGLRRGVALMQPLLASAGEEGGVARVSAAQALSALGVTLYLRHPRLTEADLDYSEQKKDLMSAEAAWQRAAQLDPSRLDVRIYLSVLRTALDPQHPERADPGIVIADRLVRADVLNMTGDAYFAAGRIDEARRYYAESMDLLNLPQRKNFRAQKGLGGL